MAKNRALESGIQEIMTTNGEARFKVRVKGRYGSWFPSKSFKRLTDARRYRGMLLGERETSRSPLLNRRIRVTFKVLWEQWLVECRSNCGDGWKKEQERMAHAYFLSYLSPMRLEEIRPREIGSIIEAARRNGRGPAMCRQIYNVLHKIFEDAVEHFEYLECSPVIRRYCPKVPKRQRNFLHPADATKLMIESKGNFLEPAVMLGLCIGLRPSEIQALRWESVDLENAQLTIRSAFNRRMNQLQPFPKQKDWGKATIPKPILDTLRRFRIGKNGEDFVAPGARGGMLNYLIFNLQLKELCRKAGVIEVTPHELRHSCTELWVFNGASQEDCGRQLNHANASTTERYMHRTHDRLQAIGSNFVLPGYLDAEAAVVKLIR